MAFYGEPQWAVVGDTFPVGCKPQPSIVFGEESFKDNPDTKDSRWPQMFPTFLFEWAGTTTSWASTRKAVALRM